LRQIHLNFHISPGLALVRVWGGSTFQLSWEGAEFYIQATGVEDTG